MSKNNDITNDRIVNMKGDKKKYDEGYDRIFGKDKNMEEHVKTLNTSPHDVVEDGRDMVERNKDD